MARLHSVTDTEFDDELRARIAASAARTERVEIGGRTLWIKRPEHLSLRMRLQKGSARKAFAAEVEAHRDYAARGLPVAPIVYAGPEALVTEDCGMHLLWRFRNGPPEAFLRAIEEAGAALASLHKAEVVHGRPSLKDICWPDQRIVFLDIERARKVNFGNGGRAMDLLILIFSTTVSTNGLPEALLAARAGYLGTGDAAVWEEAQQRARRFAPLGSLLRPVAWMLPKNAEFTAIAPFFRFMAAPH